MRRLGVYGENLPTKKDRSVNAADFSIAGLYGVFNRKYKRVFQFRNTDEAAQVLGPQTNPAYYGWDSLNGFFANLRGQPGSIIVASYPGAGAARASGNIMTYFTVKAAYQGEPEYGVAANRVAFTLTGGTAFSTTVTTAGNSAIVKVESVAGVRIGDVVKIGSTFHTVVDINESDNSITLADTTTSTIEDVVSVVGYQFKTFVKDAKGVVAEVDRGLGKTWVTFNATDPDRYIAAVFSMSSYVSIEFAAAATVNQIADIPLTYLAGGTDGTGPASVADFAAIWPMMDFQPVRMVAAVETSNSDIQKSLEEYCANREDNPIAIIVGQFAMTTKAQVLAAAQAFQRSNEVDAVFVHNWLGVPDPFASSPTAPKRAVPNAGHLMGQWIASIGMDGIHASPARKTVPLMGATEALGYAAISDFDRTDLAEAGVNVIQQMTGRGLIVRNHFTPSTSVEFRYSNALIMRNFIKISCVDSLQDSENTPNDIGHVINDRMACLFFMNRLWNQGSSGNVPTGETFGQYQKADGTISDIDEAFEIIADASNNSIASLMAGERNVDIWFAFPAPGGSIKVGVGILYRVNG